MGEPMWKKVYFVSIVFLIIVSQGIVLAEEPPQISATAGILMDKKSSQILFNKNIHTKRPPASTTKILTAIIAIEESNLEDIVTVSRKAAYQEGSSIYLKENEKISLEELIYGLMLASGNDAAVAIAEHISGSVDEFSRLMNKKAREIGAKNSNFVNPHGLPATGHVSTAYDLAMIMRYALNNKTFSEITSTKSLKKDNWKRGYKNHNQLLWSYEKATGGKTGFTKAAGRCLVSSAASDDKEMIAVVLNSPGDWVDSTNLLEFGLNQFFWKKIVSQGEIVHTIKSKKSLENQLNIQAQNDIKILVPRGGKTKIEKKIKIDSGLKLPVSENDKIGKILIYNNNQLIGETGLIAGNDLTFDSFFLRWWHRLNEFFRKT